MNRPTHPSIERARKLSTLLDSAFTVPIIKKKIGLDPLLGLLPVGGDAVSALLSTYLIWVAYELRLPKSVLVRMSVNVLLDLGVGMLPVIGDISDAFWKANKMNFRILEAAYQEHGVGARQNADGETIIDVVAEPAG